MIMKDMRGIVITASAILLVLTCLSYRRNQVWRGGNIALWQEAIQYSPNHLRPHLNLGTALAADGHIDEALIQDRWLMEHAPYSPSYQRPQDMLLSAEANAASLLIKQAEDMATTDPSASWSHYQEAAHILTRAWGESPGSPYIGLHLSALANVAGHPDIALNILDQSLSVFPGNGPPYMLAALYWSKGVMLQEYRHDCQLALTMFNLAKSIDPDLSGKPVPSCLAKEK